MDDFDFEKWAKDRKLRPEQAAAALGISISTYNNAKRGAVLRLETQEKIRENAETYDKRNQSPAA